MNDELRVAERQHGLVTRSQLTGAGLSDAQIQRRLATGRLERVYPGVYRVVGSVATPEQQALGACLWLGGDAMVSYLSAATLLRLDVAATADLHVTVAPSARRGRGHGVHIHGSMVRAADRRVVDGIPCTSAARTLVDCAGLVSEEALETAFDSARRMGLATTTTVERALDAAGSVSGTASLRRVLAIAQGAPAESRLEVKLARLLRGSDLPGSVAQFRLGPYRLDRAWPEQRVGVQADGFQHHGRRLRWKSDRARVAAIEAVGWRLVHVTWDDVTKRPEQTLDRIRMALHTMAA